MEFKKAELTIFYMKIKKKQNVNNHQIMMILTLIGHYSGEHVSTLRKNEHLRNLNVWKGSN